MSLHKPQRSGMMLYHEATKPRYGACDSFFIESDDAGIFARREEAKDKARTRQRTLASELSRITADEYQEDILSHMSFMEHETLPDVNSIDLQTEIEWFMRPYLLDFLVEAHAAFSLLPDTLFLTINLLDRYCSRRVVYKRHYQLVGCAALLIASKYGDKKDRVPQIKELKSMCCSLYEDEMFTQMEWHVLQTLDWTIGHPTVNSFILMALDELPHDREVEHMACYLNEIAVFHKEFVSVLPSTMAKSALYLARCILMRPYISQPSWCATPDQWTVNRLFHNLQQASAVVSKKYSSHNLCSVSITAELFYQRHLAMERSRHLASSNTLNYAQLDGAKPSIDGLHNPQTPQKPASSATFANGLYTPPITPDNDPSVAANVYAKHYVPMPPISPSTPSPSSTSFLKDTQSQPLVVPSLTVISPPYPSQSVL